MTLHKMPLFGVVDPGDGVPLVVLSRADCFAGADHDAAHRT